MELDSYGHVGLLVRDRCRVYQLRGERVDKMRRDRHRDDHRLQRGVGVGLPGGTRLSVAVHEILQNSGGIGKRRTL